MRASLGVGRLITRIRYDPPISNRVPYLPVEVRFGGRPVRFDALLDTGFEGDVVFPEPLAPNARRTATGGAFRLADGTQVLHPTFAGTVIVGSLGVYPVRIVALGDECPIGLRPARHFSITLDDGRRPIARL